MADARDAVKQLLDTLVQTEDANERKTLTRELWNHWKNMKKPATLVKEVVREVVKPDTAELDRLKGTITGKDFKISLLETAVDEYKVKVQQADKETKMKMECLLIYFVSTLWKSYKFPDEIFALISFSMPTVFNQFCGGFYQNRNDIKANWQQVEPEAFEFYTRVCESPQAEVKTLLKKYGKPEFKGMPKPLKPKISKKDKAAIRERLNEIEWFTYLNPVQGVQLRIEREFMNALARRFQTPELENTPGTVPSWIASRMQKHLKRLNRGNPMQSEELVERLEDGTAFKASWHYLQIDEQYFCTGEPLLSYED